MKILILILIISCPILALAQLKGTGGIVPPEIITNPTEVSPFKEGGNGGSSKIGIRVTKLDPAEEKFRQLAYIIYHNDNFCRRKFTEFTDEDNNILLHFYRLSFRKAKVWAPNICEENITYLRCVESSGEIYTVASLINEDPESIKFLMNKYAIEEKDAKAIIKFFLGLHGSPDLNGNPE